MEKILACEGVRRFAYSNSHLMRCEPLCEHCERSSKAPIEYRKGILAAFE